MMNLRAANDEDWPSIWTLFREVTAAGDTFAYDHNTSEEVAHKLWMTEPSHGFVAEVDGQFAGTYFIRPNQPGRGSHVANAGYMVAPSARGQGIASAMCEHSLQSARKMNFRAMQFNFVISTNRSALRVWTKFGFREIGRVPNGFNHAELGLVDTLILYREL